MKDPIGLVKDILWIVAGVALLAAILFAFRGPEATEAIHGHSFVVESNDLYLGNIPMKADGVIYYRTGWGPKSQAHRYAEWIRAYEAVQEWGGQVLILSYDHVDVSGGVE